MLQGNEFNVLSTSDIESEIEVSSEAPVVHFNGVEGPLCVSLRVFVEPLLLICLGRWDHIEDFILHLPRHQQDYGERVPLADFFVEGVERVLWINVHLSD